MDVLVQPVKIKHITGLGTLERVDGLVVVAHGEDVWLSFLAGVVREQFYQLELGGVGVLKLIEKDELVLFVQGEPQGIVLFEHVYGT